METSTKTTVSIDATINASVEKVWQNWTSTNAITKWNSASPDWHTTKAEHQLQPGGKFSYRMEARDGTFGFDFSGVFDVVKPNEYLESTLDDGRKVKTALIRKGNETHLSQTFEAEETNPADMQREGWQNVLNSFKNYVETLNDHIQLHYEITINAQAKKVYDTMIDKEQYSVWTAAFCPGSYFEGSWAKGSKILFIGTDEKGEKGGMVARVAENISEKFISLEYMGLLKGDEEITTGPEAEDWKGGFENYTLTEKDGSVLLSVDISGTKELQDFFSETWPLALNKLKEISEQ
jgi:uncharacterized protein YndB with AHSA1/START domain